MTETTPNLSERKSHDWIEDYMKYTEHSEPHHLYRKWTAIATLASAMQRKIYMEWSSGITIYPNMYIVLVGPPAARKGTALVQGKELMVSSDIKLAPDTITRQALIGEFANTCNAAVDSATSIAAPHSSLTVCSPELTVFLGYNNMEFITDLTDWFDCPKEWTYHTKGSGQDKIINSFFNLLGATTPTLIRTSLPTEAIGSGLASRIIFVYQPKAEKRVAYHQITSEEKMIKEILQTDLSILCATSTKLKPSMDFVDAYTIWYEQTQDGERIVDFPRFEHYRARRQIHLLKTSMIMAVSRKSDVVDVQDFQKAHALLLETEFNMPLTFAGMGKAPNAEIQHHIMEFIIERGKATIQQIMFAHNGEIDLPGLDIVLETLSAAGIVVKVIEGGQTWYKAVDMNEQKNS